MQILLSNSQAVPGRTVKQEQEEISRNHVQALFPGPLPFSMAECRPDMEKWAEWAALTSCFFGQMWNLL